MPSLLVASDNHTPRNAKSVANINSQKVKIHAALLQSVNPDRVRVIQAKSNIHSSIPATSPKPAIVSRQLKTNTTR